MTTKLTIETFPNEAAAAYIRGKAVADPENFGNLPAQLKQRAFSVAGIEQMDALRRIRDAIAKLPEGASWDEAKREVAAEISPFVGDEGRGKREEGRVAAAKARAEFLLRMHGFQAYAVARHQQQMEDIDVFPYWRYETVGDSKVRAGHAALDGKVVRADDKWWKTHYPPWDWGCRCIVVAVDEDDVKELGLKVTPGSQMPTPGGSETFAFDPSDASLDIDALRESTMKNGRGEADWKLDFVAPAKNATVQADGRESETMWELMIDLKAVKASRTLAEASQRDGKERAVLFDFATGVNGKTVVGDKGGVKVDIPDGATVCTLHTHPKGGNTPSPADLLLGNNIGSKVDYIAAGKTLCRWQWLKTPTPEDAKRIKAFDADNNANGVDVVEWVRFLKELVSNGYIKMEELS